MIVGYDADDKVWMTCIYSDPKLVKYDFKRLSVDLWHKDAKEDARELAKQKADNPSIAATALVDLVGGEEPKAIRWFYKQGDVMKSATGALAPTSASASSNTSASWKRIPGWSRFQSNE